jgi:hypothetical protein
VIPRNLTGIGIANALSPLIIPAKSPLAAPARNEPGVVMGL